MCRPGSRSSLHCSIAICAALAACHGHAGAPCTTDGDCPSHFCKLDGTCGPAPSDAPAAIDASPDASSATCTPNHDGTITAAELPLVAGRTATFRVATNATWSTAGHSNADGSRTWDLSAALANDTDQPVALLAPSGAWWQADFPMASSAAPLSPSSNL